jgi:hypothetical protein
MSSLFVLDKEVVCCQVRWGERYGAQRWQSALRVCLCGSSFVWPTAYTSGSYSEHRTQAEAHPEYGAHVHDAGGVKAQRLIESSRILPSPKGAPVRGRRVWHGDVAQREGRISSARGVRVWPSSGVCGQKAQAEAHMKHVAHVCDSGGIEAQRLVESSRSLPGSKGSSATHGNARHAKMWHRGREESAAHTRCVRVWLSSGVCGQKAQAEAHIKH